MTDVGAILAGLQAVVVTGIAMLAGAIMLWRLSDLVRGKRPPIYEGIPFLGGPMKFAAVSGSPRPELVSRPPLPTWRRR